MRLGRIKAGMGRNFRECGVFGEGRSITMKRLVLTMLLGLVLGGCGGGSSILGNINGNWTATLTNPDGSPAFTFSTSFTQGGGTSVSVTNFTFTTNSACFASPTSETGTFALSGNFNGNVTGTFGMMISTMLPAPQTNNVLTLQGAVSNNTISGTWTLTGVSGCTGNGSFTVTKI
jgi:hypothetical protein